MSLNSAPPPPPPLDDEDNDSVTKAQSALQQGSDIPRGWKPTLEKPLPAMRCRFIKSDGNRCGRWGVAGTGTIDANGEAGGWCMKHGAGLPSVRKAAEQRVAETRVRMMGATPDAFAVLHEMLKPGVPEGIRLKAATELLDRSGLKAGMEVNVTVEHVGSPLDDIMNQLEIIGGHKEPEIILEEVDDAEIVTEN